jgi:hypothetical protein
MLVKKCDHRAELICNMGNLGVAYSKSSINTKQLLQNQIKTLYKYILFPLGENLSAFKYLSLEYIRWEGMCTVVVGGCIHLNQSNTISRYDYRRRYSEGISFNPESLGHYEFYKDVWKQSDIVTFTPNRYSFETTYTESVITQLEFTDFSHMILYLGKYEYYMKLRNEHNQKVKESWNSFPFPIPGEQFMSDTYNVNISPFNKYSNIYIDIPVMIANNDHSVASYLPWSVAQTWTLKKLCWFFLKSYYEDRMCILFDRIPRHFIDQLQCIR